MYKGIMYILNIRGGRWKGVRGRALAYIQNNRGGDGRA